MSAAVAPLKIASVEIRGYRAFPNPISLRLAEYDSRGGLIGKGRNSLIYGENGSGKSSLGKALRDFLSVKSNAPKFDDFRYRHKDPPRTDRGIKIMFDDPSVDPLVWNPTHRDEAHRDFVDMARSCGWLDYRIVRRISE